MQSSSLGIRCAHAIMHVTRLQALIYFVLYFLPERYVLTFCRRGTGLISEDQPVSPERGIFRPPPRSHLGETHANVACQCVGSATRCGHQLRVKPKVHEDGLRYNA